MVFMVNATLLFLYNQTTIKGYDVEVVATVGLNLRMGLQEARTLKDTTKKCVVEAKVSIANYNLEDFFNEVDLVLLLLVLPKFSIFP